MLSSACEEQKLMAKAKDVQSIPTKVEEFIYSMGQVDKRCGHTPYRTAFEYVQGCFWCEDKML